MEIIQRVNETKNWFFKKINKINNPLFKITTRQRENIQTNKIKNEKWYMTTETEEIQENH